MEYSIYDNLQDGGWDPVDWKEITEVPSKYNSREFDVDKLFIVGDNENRLIVDRGGNVGIGTSEPKNKLDVEGSAVIGAAYSGKKTAPDNGLLIEGNVGIGTLKPNAKLHISGGKDDPGSLIIGSVLIEGRENGFHFKEGDLSKDGYCQVHGILHNESSKELMVPKSITDLSVDEALNTIKDLKTKKFKYITDKDKMYIGFIAEEVPDLVKTDKTSLSVMNIISVLTSVVQSQQDEINKLQYVSPIFGCAENRVSRMLKVPLLRFTVLDTVVATVEVGESLNSIAFDGTHIWVAGNIVNKIDIKTHEKVATVEVGIRQTSIAFDGKHIWVTDSNIITETGNVSKIDINTHKILATVEVEKAPSSIAFDGKHIWVADLYIPVLKKIDVNTHEILQTVNVGQFFSNSIAFDGTHIWVAL